jgi:prephenate dehydratase
MVQNEYCKSAYGILSKTVKYPKQIYCASFPEAYETVVYNASEFALLPIERTINGRLFGFYSMLDRYELKIYAVCTLETEGEKAAEAVRYALAGKGLPDRPQRNKRLNFEFSLISENGCLPTEVIRVGEVLGAKILKIDSLPVEYDNTQQKYYFTVEVTEKLSLALDLYLSEEYKGYTRIGKYTVI